MQDMLRRLQCCKDCSKFSLYCSALKFEPKACFEFNAYAWLKPQKITNLFIAEAPPATEPRYFYNTDIPAGTLRKGLFKQLGIEDFTKKGIETFCENNFLTDTIKCRLNKARLGQVPIELISNCATRFLREEIDWIKPKRIVLLGDTARRGIAQLEQFKLLNNLRVKKDCGKILTIGNYKIVLFAYPNTRNSKITKKHSLSTLLASA
jgi:uracil-DNA glycosylase family 4